MSTVLTISQARAALPQLLDRVGAGEEVTITRHGKAVAVLVRPDALRARRAGAAWTAAEGVRDALVEARQSPLSASPTLSPERAEAMIAEIHAGRSGR